MDATHRFAYMHIPKTGGVSFRQVMEDYVQADRILHVRETESYTPISTENYDLIHGHFSFTQVSKMPKFKKVVSLRNPIDRCISAYNFWKDQDPHLAHWNEKAKRVILAAHKLPLEDMLTHPDQEINKHFNNFQTKLLLTNFTSYTSERAQLKLARQNLEQFDFIALCDDLELSLVLFCQKFEIHPPRSTPKLNRSTNQTTIPPALNSKIENLNQLDLELFFQLKQVGLYELNR